MKITRTATVVRLGMVMAFGLWVAAWGQDSKAPVASTGEAAQTEDSGGNGALCAVLIGVSDEQNSPLARSTAESDLTWLEEALQGLGATTGKTVDVKLVLGTQLTPENMRDALRECAQAGSPKDLVLVYYVGSVFAGKGIQSSQWWLTTADSLTSPEGTARVGVSFQDFAGYLKPLAGRPVLAVFSVLVYPETGVDVQGAAASLAEEVNREGASVLVLAASRDSYLESPTSTESYLARALADGIGRMEADDIPTGDSDARVTLEEVSHFLSARVTSSWAEGPDPTKAGIVTRGLTGSFGVLAVRPERQATLDSWKIQLGQIVAQKGMDPKLMVEARSLLTGEHNIQGIPEERRGDLIDLVGRLVRNEISAEDYSFQRSVMLGEQTPGQGEPGAVAGTPSPGVWGGLPFLVRFLIIAGLGALVVYLLSRVILGRQAPKETADVPVMAEDFLSFGPDGSKGSTKAAGGAKGTTDSKKVSALPLTSIRPVKPVSGPSASSGGLSPGVSAPTPVRSVSALTPPRSGAVLTPLEIRPVAPPATPSAPSGKPTEPAEEGFEHIERPPSVADLRARTGKKSEAPAAPTPAKPVPAVAAPSAHPHPPVPEVKPQEPQIELVSASDDGGRIELDLDAASGAQRAGGSAVLPGSQLVTPEMSDQPTARFEIRPIAPSVPPPSVAASGGAAKVPVSRGAPAPSLPTPPKPVPATPPVAPAPSPALVPPISPGVLPAVIRAWDLEWTGPLARSRFRILMGTHLEMGRPAVTKEGEEAELTISLLPVGDDRKPNPALIAMLSRKAFTFDLGADGVQTRVLNKASAHLSSDPNRPYWDWENPMPGTERLIAPAETVWLSPHFGKTLAPISIRCLRTAGSLGSVCASEMRFDAVFQDLAGLTVILMGEDFELMWGTDSPCQIAPGVGEDPKTWLKVTATRHGVTILPLEGGKWSRRQGKMLDEQTLLLGGVSSVEWKSEGGEMVLKLTPHALPRLSAPAAKSGSGPKSS